MAMKGRGGRRWQVKVFCWGEVALSESLLFLVCTLYKTKRFHTTMVCSVTDHRRRQNVVKTPLTHSPAARVPLFCFYHIVTRSVIWYWTDPRQHGIYLLNRQCITFHDSLLLPRYPLNAFSPHGHFTGLQIGAKADTDWTE